MGSKWRLPKFKTERSEEVVFPHWRHRPTPVALQKSASLGYIDEWFSSLRPTPMPSDRHPMSQSLAPSKRGYETMEEITRRQQGDAVFTHTSADENKPVR